MWDYYYKPLIKNRYIYDFPYYFYFQLPYPSDRAPLTCQGHRGLAEALDTQLLQEHFEDEDPFGNVDGDNRYAAEEFTALKDDDNEIEQEGHGADATPSPLNISDVNENLSGSHHPNTSS